MTASSYAPQKRPQIPSISVAQMFPTQHWLTLQFGQHLPAMPPSRSRGQEIQIIGWSLEASESRLSSERARRFPRITSHFTTPRETAPCYGAMLWMVVRSLSTIDPSQPSQLVQCSGGAWYASCYCQRRSLGVREIRP